MFWIESNQSGAVAGLFEIHSELNCCARCSPCLLCGAGDLALGDLKLREEVSCAWKFFFLLTLHLVIEKFCPSLPIPIF